MTAPGGETAKDRRRQWYLGIATVVALLSIMGNVALGATNYRNQQAYNAATANRQHEILGLIGAVRTEQAHQAARDKEILTLQKEVATVIDGLPAADTYLGALARGLEAQIQAVCQAVSARGCPPLTPALPTSTPSVSPSPTGHAAPTSPTTTTTTTVHHPGHGGSAPGYNK